MPRKLLPAKVVLKTSVGRNRHSGSSSGAAVDDAASSGTGRTTWLGTVISA
ncbi:MAG: hypothetical protein U1E65_05475 [Myxococcota bacterium]